MISGDAQRLEERIVKARARASSPDLTDEDRAWLGEMAAIWASGYLEAAFRDTLRQYVETRADSRVQRAMNRRLERFRNPRLGVILDLVGEFDTTWQEELRSFADGAVGESVNSIVALRHRIAHGRSDRVSIGTVGRYFDEARRLPRRLVKLCGGSLGA